MAGIVRPEAESLIEEVKVFRFGPEASRLVVDLRVVGEHE